MRTLFAAFLALWFSMAATPGFAQEAKHGGIEDGWSFKIAPYAWIAGIDGETKTFPKLGAPSSGVSIDFGDLLKSLDGALMVTGEVRKDRYAFIFDVLYLKLSADGPTPFPLFSGVEVQTKASIATLAGSYRAFADERYTLDVLAGARIWNVALDVTLKPGALAQRSAEISRTWADPIIGAAASVDLGSGFNLSFTGTVGGFGVASDLTWGAFGGVGYEVSDWFSAFAGYRHLAVDFEDGGFLYNANLSGPIIGFVFRF